MNQIIKEFLNTLGRFFAQKKNRRLLYLLIIGIVAFVEFFNLGLVRRTLVFYSIIEGNVVVEDRMLKRSSDRETSMRRYMEEALLGPVSPGLALLFPRDTRLNSFMFRDSVVYADLSESAALPLDGTLDVFSRISTLKEGVKRNFSYVRDIRLFIEGNEVFFEEFRGFLVDPADNI